MFCIFFSADVVAAQAAVINLDQPSTAHAQHSSQHTLAAPGSKAHHADKAPALPTRSNIKPRYTITARDNKKGADYTTQQQHQSSSC